ncbi:phage protein [Streptococcus pneumoniae]|nr:phage protein [Streptococcus pneumoniae]
MVELFLKELKQLDEPKPVKVPQFVADWIDYFKKTGDWDLFQAMDYLFGKKEIREWLEYKNNQDLFARAWLDGYEVEKEKRYLVKIKGNIKENMLVYGELLERYFFTKSFSLDDAIYSHTRKELENAKIGWVFDCEGFEIEEVE